MSIKKNEIYTLDQVKDKIIGEKGNATREDYEYALTLDVLGELIKKIRKERNLTQEKLGELIGVQKAQISRLERNAGNVTISTVIRVFKALNAQIRFNILLGDDQHLGVA